MRANLKRAGLAVAAWDAAWKAIAIRRAIKNRHWKWVPVLAAVNSAGLVPLLYLTRWGRVQPAGDEQPGDA
ncbi:MAG: hypothetical protein KJ053_10915 [Dehalococcoidia bacterium]|nr:hypothetical protein [Dehalococcoidia bacterium]